MPNRIIKFINLPGKLKILFFEALFLQYYARILLIFFPFRRIPRFFSDKRFDQTDINPAILEQIKEAIRYANHLSIWKNKCLVQSMAAKWMLQRRKINADMSFGLTHGKNKKLIAHAWVKVNDTEIVPKIEEYTELYRI